MSKPDHNPPIRVVVQHPALPKYRVPVFRELAARPGIDLLVAYAAREEIPNAEPNGFRAVHAADRRRWVGSHPLVWDPAQIRYANPALADVLFLTWDLHYLSLVPALLRARNNGTATVLWGHGYSKRERRFRRRARAEIGNLATALMFYNHTTAAAYVQDGVNPRRVFIAPNALDQTPIREQRAIWERDPERVAAFRRQHGLNGPTILFVSRLEHENRLDLLLTATAVLRRTHPTLSVIVIGNGEEEAALRRQATSLRLDDRIRFLGGIYDESALAPWFLCADVFCYPANIGLSLLHAFGYGVPVVTSNLTEAQNPEIEALRPGENGLTYRDGDAADLVATLDRLLSDRSLRQQLSQGAMRTLDERFSIEKMVDGMVAAARYCIGSRGPLHVERRFASRQSEERSSPAGRVSTTIGQPATPAAPINLAIVSNSITPYRVHVHRRIARELPAVRLNSVFTHGLTNADWTLDVPPEINPVMFGKGESSDVQDRLAGSLREWRKAGRIIRWLRERDVRVVVVQGYNDVGRLRIIRWCRRNRVPCFLSGDSNILGDRTTGAKKWLKARLLPRIIRQCSGIMPVGSRGAAYFEKYGAAPRHIFLFPYEPDYQLIRDVPPDLVQQVRARFALSSRRRRILFAGRMIREKRPDMAIESFARIADRRPEWDLVMLGDGVRRARLQASVPPDLTSRVIWAGFIPRALEVAAMYRTCDVLVLPSDYEPWAVVVNEAAAAGLALVCSDVVGAAAELVRDGVNGWTFRSGDVGALTERLLQVTDPANVERLKQASADVLAEWQRVGDPVRNLWHAVEAATSTVSDARVFPSPADDG
jgi:glycosyltransferase involved in cell wall biosynthesis